MREQRLKSLEQQQNNYENQQLKMFKQEETKSIRLKNLQNQLNTQATFGSLRKKEAFCFLNNKQKIHFLGNQLELLKQIYLNKEQELNNSLSKLDESTKQLDQIRKLKLIVNNDQKEDKNQLEKLKQELMVSTFVFPPYFSTNKQTNFRFEQISMNNKVDRSSINDKYLQLNKMN